MTPRHENPTHATCPPPEAGPDTRAALRPSSWLGVLALALLLVGLGLLVASAQAASAAPAAPTALVVGSIDPVPGADSPLPVARYVAPTAVRGEDELAPGRWEVRTQDITLSRTLERWAAQAGYRLKWDAGRNFLIGAPDTYEGRFEDALQAVLGSAGIRGSDYPLEACIYANTPPLVRITRQGEQARECRAS